MSIVISIVCLMQAVLNLVLCFRVRDINRKLNETYDDCCLQYGYIDRLRQRVERVENLKYPGQDKNV